MSLTFWSSRFLIGNLCSWRKKGTTKEGMRLFAALDRPNVMVKVPATPEGIPAIRRLTAEGVNSDVKYVEPLIGPDTTNTMPMETINAFLDHGKAEKTIDQDIDQSQQDLKELKRAGIDLDQLTDKLLADGIKAFSDSFEKLMAGIEKKKSQLLGKEQTVSAGIGKQGKS